ncbi:MAG: AI-2E family transporter [Clostridium sp.]|nr:AI-2E family transporter [Clostridium sp.]
MKWKVEKKYLSIGAVAFCVIALAILFQYMLEHEARVEEFQRVISGTMMPIIFGFVFAYLLNPILNFFERYCFLPLAGKIWRKEAKEEACKRFSRGVGILCTIIFFLIILIGGLYMVIPQLYQSLVTLVTDAPNYYNTVVKWVDSLHPDNPEVSKYVLMGLDRVYSQALAYLNNSILPNMDKIVVGVTSGIVGGLKMILNVVLALIISIYVMAEKEILVSIAKKLVFSLFNVRNANTIVRGARYANQIFGGFINGKIIDSFIIGVICYCFMRIVGLEYAVLISILVGVTNIIPYFGPFIGAIPSALILLMVDYKQGLIFVVFVLVLQQVDGNIIGPIIIGDRLQISSMWILFAILVGGGFFGVPGMILGAPCFACIYALVSSLCKMKLEAKNLPLDTAAYYDIDRIADDGQIHTLEEEISVTMEEIVKEINVEKSKDIKEAGKDIEKEVEK